MAKANKIRFGPVDQLEDRHLGIRRFEYLPLKWWRPGVQIPAGPSILSH